LKVNTKIPILPVHYKSPEWVQPIKREQEMQIQVLKGVISNESGDTEKIFTQKKGAYFLNILLFHLTFWGTKRKIPPIKTFNLKD